ncbi:MAG: hypothetical protein J6R47_06200 [Acholeplasmatales bacterium]|nr:hypothetical protein [Acholeplasmatales bacterium]
MKKMKGILIGLFSLILTLCLASCFDKNNEGASYVTLEINPGVEFVVEFNGTVSAANGLNDDGKMLVSEEELVGKDLDAAIEIVLNAAVECKYLNKGEDSKFSKDISLSVSAITDAKKSELVGSISTTIDTYVLENEINAASKVLEAKGREYFEGIALKYDPSLTSEELKEMSYQDLMSYVELATIEKAKLVNMALEEYYISFKEYQFELQYKEQIAEKLKSTVSTVTSALYSAAYYVLSGAVNVIEELQYNIFVSPDSNYLKFLSELQKYKDENTKLTYKLSMGGANTEIEATINLNKEKIEQFEAKIIEIMNGFNSSLESAKTGIKNAIEKLEEIEEKISQINYIELLNNVENTINNTKTGLLATFEEKYADDIAKAKNNVALRKAELEKSIQ